MNQLALTPQTGVPTKVEVMEELFRDKGDPQDDYYWVLFRHGTFYSVPKSAFAGKIFDGDDFVAHVLQMSNDSILSDRDDGDEVAVYALRDLWTHPTFMVLSPLRQALGWVVVADTKDCHWPTNDDESKQVGYLARTLYELDCRESSIIATNFTWSCK